MKSNFKNSERAVSPVIGVILMVAITVILAAVIGTFVLDLGNSSVQQNPQAGISFDQTRADDDTSTGATVDITINSIQRGNNIQIKVSEAGTSGVVGSNGASPAGTSITTGVGESTSVTGLETGDKITVTADYEGNTAVVAQFTVN